MNNDKERCTDMIKTIVKDSYNMDLLSFINVMTADEFYVKFYEKEYNLFYPLISDMVKGGINALTASAGRSNIAPFFTTIISSLDDNNNRDVKEMLFLYDDIDTNMQKSPYYDMYKDYIKMLPQLSGLIVQLIKELEDNGFRAYWEKEKLPQIKNRCEEISKLLGNFDIAEQITKYKDLDAEDITIFVGAFSNPHATRLCGNVMLVDYIYSDKIIVNNVVHELFHPPYKYEEVKDLISRLGKLNFVLDAFKNQNPKFIYDPIEMFIEENIVEALAVYVVFSMGLEDKPFEYFEKHDEGSHVISPHLFRYLQKNDIEQNQSFNDYFERFIEFLESSI